MYPNGLFGISLYPKGEVKTYFFKKGDKRPLAITKEQKREMVAQYGEWLDRSDAFVLAEYTGMNMNDTDALRTKIREAGGEFTNIEGTPGPHGGSAVATNGRLHSMTLAYLTPE